jgi:hypothetical protein
MHARLAEVMDYVEEKRKELLASFADARTDRLQRHPAPDRWSVAEIVEHLRLVESGVARLVSKRAAQSKAAGAEEEKCSESVMSSFDRHRSALSAAAVQAPATVRPRGDVDMAEALTGLESSRQALREAAASASNVALGQIRHPHPILGDLDLYQWLIFVGDHEDHHTRQIKRTLQSIAND